MGFAQAATRMFSAFSQLSASGSRRDVIARNGETKQSDGPIVAASVAWRSAKVSRAPRDRHVSLLLAMTVVAALIAGCGTSPPSRFFTLAAEPAIALTTADAKTASIVVGPVSVPEIVDRPQLVLRTSPTTVEIAELARWAAPLKSEIPRVIASQLASLLPGVRITTSSQRTPEIPDYRVVVDVQRFESTLAGSAVIEAAWTVRPREGKGISGRSVATEPAGAGYDALVAAHSRALRVITRDIAAAISSHHE